MFEKSILLKASEHAGIMLGATRDWRFAAQEVIVPVVYSEIADVAREYPLLFIAGKSLLYALTGIEQGVNAYVGADGRWLATYVPARLAAYPLALAEVPQKPGEYALVLDGAAPQLLAHDGEPLFVAGEPSPLLKRRMQLLESMQKAERITHQVVNRIRDADLLVPRTIRVSRPGGEGSQLTGLEVIDERRLNALPHDAFAALRDGGALPVVYAHLLSMANLRQGVLVGRYPQLATPGADEPLDELFKSDVLRFN